jgi:hypothetical protein
VLKASCFRTRGPCPGVVWGRPVRAHCRPDSGWQSRAYLVSAQILLSRQRRFGSAYATDFCGVKSLREATREQVEAFVEQLADWAEKDRNALLCQLNSYMVNKEKEDVA